MPRRRKPNPSQGFVPHRADPSTSTGTPPNGCVDEAHDCESIVPNSESTQSTTSREAAAPAAEHPMAATKPVSPESRAKDSAAPQAAAITAPMEPSETAGAEAPPPPPRRDPRAYMAAQYTPLAPTSFCEHLTSGAARIPSKAAAAALRPEWLTPDVWARANKVEAPSPATARPATKAPTAAAMAPPLVPGIGAVLDTPRGLMNTGNACYLNATLQALVHLPPLAHWLAACGDDDVRGAGGTLSAQLGAFVLQYYDRRRSVPMRAPSDLVLGSGATATAFTGLAQEDCAEYLQTLLERLSAEAAGLVGTGAHSKPQGEGTGRGWVTVGKSESLRVKATAHASAESPLTRHLFSGALQTHTRQDGGPARTVVRPEHFFFLPVSISQKAATTLEEALRHTLAREAVENAHRGTVTRRQELLACPLPPVLVIQLKRWAVTAEGEVVKIDNAVTFGPQLHVPAEVCSDPNLPGPARQYELRSVLCHRGTTAQKGHYVTYLRHTQTHANTPLPAPAAPGGAKRQPPASLPSPSGSAARPHQQASPGAGWTGSGPSLIPMTLCDDNRITASSLAQALRDTPYFLFYQKVS